MTNLASMRRQRTVTLQRIKFTWLAVGVLHLLTFMGMLTVLEVGRLKIKVTMLATVW